MQTGMVIGPAHAPEPRALPDDRAGTHVDRLHRHVRHPPAATAHGHEAAARADAAGHHDPAAARRAHVIAGRGREVRAAVLAAGERVVGEVEPGRDAPVDGIDEDQRDDGCGEHSRTVRPLPPAAAGRAWIGTQSARTCDWLRRTNVNGGWVRERGTSRIGWSRRRLGLLSRGMRD